MLAGKDADAEGEAVVLAAKLVHPVFGDGGLASLTSMRTSACLQKRLDLVEETRSWTASRISGITSMLTFWARGTSG